jgi:alpha-N-acetylgalactosaminidase|eukprot:Stramenopile-MAST_4_protein_3702
MPCSIHGLLTQLSLRSGLLLLLACLPTFLALDNGLARTPPMGWMSWERFRCTVDCSIDPDNCVTETLIREHADILAQPEWLAAGYSRVNVDDCWANIDRSENGTLVGNTTRFPSGMKALADYVHGKGLQLGIYNDMGTKTCGGYPGECKDKNCSLPGYMGVDAEVYAQWGIDSIKVDGCNVFQTSDVLSRGYRFFGDQLNRTGRPIMYSCSWPDYIRLNREPVNYTLIGDTCNMWRMYDDIQDSWESVLGIIDWVGNNGGKGSPMQVTAGPGRWNDPDMLIIGNYALSETQARSQLALWCIMAAPLMMGNDLRHLAPNMKEILTNKEALAVDQDPLGVQGWRVAQDTGLCTAHDVWMKPLSNGDVAVVLFNRGVCGTHTKLNFSWELVELPAAKAMQVRDLFAGKDVGTFTGSFSGFVDPDGVRMLRLSPAPGFAGMTQ